jgi:hypothetical protein
VQQIWRIAGEVTLAVSDGWNTALIRLLDLLPQEAASSNMQGRLLGFDLLTAGPLERPKHIWPFLNGVMDGSRGCVGGRLVFWLVGVVRAQATVSEREGHLLC